MSGIRSKNTRPEMIVRSGLHRAGLRYRLHDKSLPGKPDLVFPKHRAVIFVHGCFWHRHDCSLFKWPKTREEFWRKKIERNREVDARALAALGEAGWRCGVVWECALKGGRQERRESPISDCVRWLKGKKRNLEIRGQM